MVCSAFSTLAVTLPSPRVVALYSTLSSNVVLLGLILPPVEVNVKLITGNCVLSKSETSLPSVEYNLNIISDVSLMDRVFGFAVAFKNNQFGISTLYVCGFSL